MTSPPDIIAITEANPKNSKFQLQPSEYSTEGYEAHVSIAGRGIIVWVRHGLEATPQIIDTGFQESLWIKIKLQDRHTLLFGCIYRSPNSTQENNQHLNELIKNLNEENFTHLLICGDFNFPNINWETNTSQDPVAQDFLDSCDDTFIHQHIQKPTRTRTGQHPHVLDLVFSNEEEMVRTITHESPLGKSDHSCLTFKYLCTVDKKDNLNGRVIQCFERGDYQAINTRFMSTNWQEELQGTTQEAYDKFCTIFHQACEEHVPTRTLSSKKKSLRGLTTNECEIIRKKHRAWTRFIETRDDQKYKDYTKLRNKVKAITRRAIVSREKDIARNAKEHPKRFWSYVKSKTRVKERIPDLVTDTGALTSNDLDKAETLSAFFVSVFTEEPDQEIPRLQQQQYEDQLIDIDISDEDIRTTLSKLKPGKSMGTDDIHPYALRETASSVAKPLGIIFRQSIREGAIPNQWREAYVTAIHKKGDKTRPQNYRPISLTSIPCKILESLIRRAILHHMMTNDLLTPCQFGFVERRSAALQLLHTIEDWVQSIDEGHIIDVCFLDIMKAFDTVPHMRLMEKMRSYGIAGCLLEWIASFLSNRSQQVRINGTISRPRSVTSGVPQGSVLGPMLFVIYINDLPDLLQSTTKLYADDAKVYCSINSPDDETKLQNDIKRLEEWSSKWLLRFHPEKCSMLRVALKERPKNTYLMHDSNLGEVTLAWQKEEKDLGVKVDERLTFQNEIDSRVKKANTIVGLIRRTFTHLNANTFKKLYKALVRPHLEYGASVWSPHLQRNIKKIETVQRRATKQIPGFRHLTYEERLLSLKLQSLEQRRKRGDLIETYKIIHGLYNIKAQDFFTFSTTTTRGHSKKLMKPRANTNLRLHNFSYRTIQKWNELPESIITAPTLNSFKTRLDKHSNPRPR